MLQITIKDIDTNEVYLDRQADALVGSLIDTTETEDEIEISTATCIYGEGSPQVILDTLNTLNEEVRKILFGRFLEQYAEVRGISSEELESTLTGCVAEKNS